MIELVIFDIDGVLTDGSILVNSQGQEQNVSISKTSTQFLN